MSNKVIKSVSLNVTVAEDQLILNHIKRRNFSGYVKKLIMADIEAKKNAKAQIEATESVKPAPIATNEIKVGEQCSLKPVNKAADN